METTIQIKKETLNRLKTFKEYDRESYDELVNKLIDDIEEMEFTEEAIEGIKRGLDDIKAGRTKSIKEFSKEIGIKLE